MCGIVGGVAERCVTEILIEGLKRLEYRGYDSAGVALLNNQQILRERRVAMQLLNTSLQGLSGSHIPVGQHTVNQLKIMLTRICLVRLLLYITVSLKTTKN